MSDRLKELQRLRALAQEQVTWFDREIARETGVTSGAGPASGPVPPAAVPSIPVANVGALHAPSRVDAESILEQYRSPQGSIKDNVRKGCFLYFFVAFAIVGLAAAAVYFAFRR
jgi:hypothetical protein